MITKPTHRSRLRLFIGGLFFACMRFFRWYTSRETFAKIVHNDKLPFSIFHHQSILLRQLKNVDMRLQHNKIKNLAIALQKLDGVIVKPGETFSYWMLIGRPTKSKGYVAGMLLRNGVVREGIGGGLCQLSNLIYWMTLHTPLTVVERFRHGYDVFPDSNRTQPFGSGATCSYPYIDLQIKNNTTSTFQLTLQLTDSHLTGSWLADTEATVQYTILEKEHTITHEWWGGYVRHNELWKVGTDISSGDMVSEECVAQNHAILMYNPLIENKFNPVSSSV